MDSIPLKRCSKCKKEYPATAEYFQRHRDRKDGFHAWCKSCKHVYAKIQGKINYQEHREERLAAAKVYHNAHPEKQQARHRKWYLANKEVSNQRVKENAKNLRLKVLGHYGMQCACCGENHLEFLAIDHINGGGSQHRKSLKISNLYRWLRDNNFPEGFRTLCHNCNMALGLYGYCPHQK